MHAQARGLRRAAARSPAAVRVSPSDVRPTLVDKWSGLMANEADRSNLIRPPTWSFSASERPPRTPCLKHGRRALGGKKLDKSPASVRLLGTGNYSSGEAAVVLEIRRERTGKLHSLDCK